MEDSDEEFVTSSGDDSDPVTPRNPQLEGEALYRSGRAKKSVTGGYAEGYTDYVDADAFEDIGMTPPDSLAEPRTAAPSVDGAQMPGLAQSQNRKLGATVFKPECQEDTLVAMSNVNPAQPLEEEAMTEVESSEIELVVDEEETKPKPLLQLTYQGFNIFGHCLCVVVEPWPPIRAVSRAPSIAPMFSNPARAPNIAPPDFIPTGQVETMGRERTPLFLPDPDGGRSETPAPFNQGRMLPPVPLFNDPIDQGKVDFNDESLMEFSQALNYASEHRQGLEDDDEMDGAVFFGDADETREF